MQTHQSISSSSRAWQEFSLPGISVRVSFIFFPFDLENSRSRLEAQDWQKDILVFVSKHGTERIDFSFLSQHTRLAERNSRLRFSFKFLKKRNTLLFLLIEKLKVFFENTHKRQATKILEKWELSLGSSPTKKAVSEFWHLELLGGPS